MLACDSDDDGFYNTKYVQADGLVNILNPAATYPAGSPIMIEAHVPHLLPESGQAEPLDVVETTGNAPTFEFSYFLEKKNADGQWEMVDLTGQHVDDGPGHATVGYFIQAYLEFEDSNQYEYFGSIVPSQTGEYRLNFSNNTVNYNKVFIRSDSQNNNIDLKIFSTSDDLDGNGYFAFTVN